MAANFYSNINGSFFVTTTGSIGIGSWSTSDTLGYDLNIKSNNAQISLESTHASGATYILTSVASDNFVISKDGVGDRLAISSAGAITFNNAYTFPTAVTATNNYVLTAQTDGSTAWAAEGSTGTVTGSGVANRVAYWTTASNISYNDDFKYTGANKIALGGDIQTTLVDFSTIEIGNVGMIMSEKADSQYNSMIISSNAYYTSGWKYKTASVVGANYMSLYQGKIIFATAPAPTTAGDAITWSTKMTILNNGNVGIGTTAPVSTWLTTFDPTTGNGTFKLTSEGWIVTPYLTGLAGYYPGQGARPIVWADDSGTNLQCWDNSATDGVSLRSSNGTTRLFVREDGNVGIGTSSPAYKLHVADTGDDTLLKIENTTVNKYPHIRFTALGAEYDIGVGGTGTATGYVNNLYIYDITNSAPRITLTQAGNVGIGTTININAPLTVQADGSAYGINLIGRSNGVYDESVIGFYDNDGTTRKGYILNSAGNMYFATGGSTENMVIDSSGNVGIGTTSPNVRLGLSNSTALTAVYQQFTNGTTGTTGGDGTFMGIDSDGDFLINNQEAKTIKLYTSDIERMRIQSNGSVGIGVDTAAASVIKLRVVSDVNSDWIAEFKNTNTLGNTYGLVVNTLAGAGTYNLGCYTHTGTGFFVQNNGNVGIGTTSPGGKLHIKGDGLTQNLIRLQHDGTGGNGYFDINVVNDRANLVANYSSTAIPMRFITGAAERMRITSGGDILFRGTSVPSASYLIGSGFKYDSKSRATLVQASDNNTLTDLQEYFNTNGAVGKIQTSGSATIFNTSSDYRLKEDLKDFNGLDMVSNINVYDFKWKIDGKRSYGVLAHELQEVIPDAAAGEKDLVNEDGSINPQGVDYSKIVPILIKSIQELKAEIDVLKSK